MGTKSAQKVDLVDDLSTFVRATLFFIGKHPSSLYPWFVSVQPSRPLLTLHLQPYLQPTDSMAMMDEMRDGRGIDSGAFKCTLDIALCEGM